MWQCLFVVAETQQGEKGKMQFCTLSLFQYIMLTRGILWARATITATLCPPPLSLFVSLYPSYHTACFLPPLFQTPVCVCCLCICYVSAQHVSPVWVCSSGFMHIYILDVWFLRLPWWLWIVCECVHVCSTVSVMNLNSMSRRCKSHASVFYAQYSRASPCGVCMCCMWVDFSWIWTYLL